MERLVAEHLALLVKLSAVLLQGFNTSAALVRIKPAAVENQAHGADPVLYAKLRGDRDLDPKLFKNLFAALAGSEFLGLNIVRQKVARIHVGPRLQFAGIPIKANT